MPRPFLGTLGENFGLSLRFSPQKISPYSQRPRLTTLQTGFPNPEHTCSVLLMEEESPHRPCPWRAGGHREVPAGAGGCVNRKPGKTGPPWDRMSQPGLWQFVCLGTEERGQGGNQTFKEAQ